MRVGLADACTWCQALARVPAECDNADDRANVPIRLLNLDGFVRHYVDVYDRADDGTRSILPLIRILGPA